MDDEKALIFIREEIDSIDAEIIALLESRLNFKKIDSQKAIYI